MPERAGPCQQGRRHIPAAEVETRQPTPESRKCGVYRSQEKMAFHDAHLTGPPHENLRGAFMTRRRNRAEVQTHQFSVLKIHLKPTLLTMENLFVLHYRSARGETNRDAAPPMGESTPVAMIESGPRVRVEASGTVSKSRNLDKSA